MNQHSDTGTAAALAAARRRLIVMMLVPLLAIGAAYAVFFTGVGLPNGTTNRGILVEPPATFANLELRGPNGAVLTGSDLQGDWLMVYVGRSFCDEVCAQRLWLMRQVRTALGKDAGRLRRIYIDRDAQPEAELRSLIDTEHRDLNWFSVPTGAWAALMANSRAPDPEQQPIFLVDPRGFLMMAYTPAHDGQDILKDLRFLLKYSWEKTRNQGPANAADSDPPVR